MMSGRFQAIKCQWHRRQDPILLPQRGSHDTLFGGCWMGFRSGAAAPALFGIELGQLWPGQRVAVEENPRRALQPQ